MRIADGLDVNKELPKTVFDKEASQVLLLSGLILSLTPMSLNGCSHVGFDLI